MAPALHVDLPQDPSASGVARRHISRFFADERPGYRLDDLLLVVTELVNNAVVHGSGEVRLRLRLTGNRVRCEVADHGSGFEPGGLRTRGAQEPGGWGLSIVDRATADWGLQKGTGDVWFEMELQASAPPP